MRPACNRVIDATGLKSSIRAIDSRDATSTREMISFDDAFADELISAASKIARRDDVRQGEMMIAHYLLALEKQRQPCIARAELRRLNEAYGYWPMLMTRRAASSTASARRCSAY